MSDYFLQPNVLGLPAGMPGLRHNYQADGRADDAFGVIE